MAQIPDADGTHRHRAHRRGRCSRRVRRARSRARAAHRRPDAPRSRRTRTCPVPRPRSRCSPVLARPACASPPTPRRSAPRAPTSSPRSTRRISGWPLDVTAVSLGEGAVEGPRLARWRGARDAASRRSPSPAATSSSSGVRRKSGAEAERARAHRRSTVSADLVLATDRLLSPLKARTSVPVVLEPTTAAVPSAAPSPKPK